MPDQSIPAAQRKLPAQPDNAAAVPNSVSAAFSAQLAEEHVDASNSQFNANAKLEQQQNQPSQ